MIRHYLKIAFRHLLKHKVQTLLSLFGLAIGFVCFTLSILWIHYEMTYDAFHDNAKQIYCVRQEVKNNTNEISNVNPYPLAAYLKETFAEVGGACSIQYWPQDYKLNGQNIKLNELSLDSAALSVFHLEVLEGNKDFLQPGESKKVAITRRCARRLFGTESPIGKEIFSPYNPTQPITISTILSEWPEHSNFPYDIVTRTRKIDIWYASGWQTFIRLKQQADEQTFSRKLYNHIIEKERNTITHLVLTPITALRYDHPLIEADVKLKHVTLFAVAGALVVLCSLLNYITLFISHIRMRGKELALRIVNGSSTKGLFLLLISEFSLLLFFAMLTGMLCIEIIMPEFKELAAIKLDRTSIYLEAAAYCLGTIMLAMLLSSFPILYYRKKSLQNVLTSRKGSYGKNLFRKASVVFQLIVSIGFIFCASLMMKQLHYLTHTDMGMKRENIASLKLYPAPDVVMLGDKIAQIPEIEQVLPGHAPLIPFRGAFFMNIEDWEDKRPDASPVSLQVHQEDTTFANFYGLTMLEGEMITPSSPQTDMVLNEAAVKAFGWKDAVGKTMHLKDNDSTVIRVTGVMKNYYADSPTMPVKPICYVRKYAVSGFSLGGLKDNILFSYKKGTWPVCKQKIEQLAGTEYPDAVVTLCDTEEEYAKFLTSENALLKLLGSLSLVCILISTFAIYSLVTLTCEQRQKEVAIRKVNGAKISDILSMFMKEYFTLLAIASVIAFPIAYAIMKHWIENYAKQTGISLWLYPVISGGIAQVMAAAIGWRVWKAASQNPAEVIKNE